MVVQPYLATLAEIRTHMACLEATWLMELFEFCAQGNRSVGPHQLFEWLAERGATQATVIGATLAYRRFIRSCGKPDPVVQPDFLANYKRVLRRAPAPRHTLPDPSKVMPALFEAAQTKPTALRNVAMLLLRLLVGATADDILRLERNHIMIDVEGLRVFLPTATDFPQRAIRRFSRPRYCPVATIEAWLMFHQQDRVFTSHKRGCVGAALTAAGVAHVLGDTFAMIGYHEGLTALRYSLVIRAHDRGATVEQIAMQFGYCDIAWLKSLIQRYRPEEAAMARYLA